jgi:hypothetical protein
MTVKVTCSNKFVQMQLIICFIEEEIGMKKIEVKELILIKFLSNQICSNYKNELIKT